MHRKFMISTTLAAAVAAGVLILPGAAQAGTWDYIRSFGANTATNRLLCANAAAQDRALSGDRVDYQCFTFHTTQVAEFAYQP